MLKLRGKRRGKRAFVAVNPLHKIHKVYLLTSSTAFLEAANHSASKLAQCAFLESSEQLAGAFSTRDWTFVFACFFNQQKQVRESPGFGMWEAEKENPLGASSEDCNLSLHNTRAANLVVRNVTKRAEITRAQFLLSLNSQDSCVTFVQ